MNTYIYPKSKLLKVCSPQKRKSFFLEFGTRSLTTTCLLILWFKRQAKPTHKCLTS